jgi:hypothetical protein
MPPTTVKKRALDVTPYHHGIWCTCDDFEGAFVNEIVLRNWSEDGKQVVWKLFQEAS